MPTNVNADFEDLDAVRKVVEALSAFDKDQQKRVLRWAREKLGLPEEASHTPSSPVPPPPPGAHAASGDGEHPKTTNIKTFIETKKPSSDNQFAAAVAYFYRFEAPEHLRKEAINKDDLLEACRQVGRTRINRPDQTLVNAHGQGLLDREEKGSYSINTVGENLVAVALPSDGAARPSPRRSAKKKPSTRKTARPRKAASAKRAPRKR